MLHPLLNTDGDRPVKKLTYWQSLVMECYRKQINLFKAETIKTLHRKYYFFLIPTAIVLLQKLSQFDNIDLSRIAKKKLSTREYFSTT